MDHFFFATVGIRSYPSKLLLNANVGVAKPTVYIRANCLQVLLRLVMNDFTEDERVAHEFL